MDDEQLLYRMCSRDRRSTPEDIDLKDLRRRLNVTKPDVESGLSFFVSLDALLEANKDADPKKHRFVATVQVGKLKKLGLYVSEPDTEGHIDVHCVDCDREHQKPRCHPLKKEEGDCGFVKSDTRPAPGFTELVARIAKEFDRKPALTFDEFAVALAERSAAP